PEDGLARLENVASYMGQYEKCIGTRQLRPGPLPKAYTLKQSTTITQEMLDTVGYRFRTDDYDRDKSGYYTYSSGMLIDGDVRFFISKRGQVISMEKLLTRAGVSSYDVSHFAGDEDYFVSVSEMFNGDLVLQLGEIERSDRYSDQYETKYLLRLDHNLNKVMLLDMDDYYGCGDDTLMSEVREGAEGELIVTCETYADYAGKRYVFNRTGETIDQETAEIFEYNDGIFGDKTELRWDDRWNKYYQKEAIGPKRQKTGTNRPYTTTSIGMKRGDMEATVDMSTMNFTRMHRNENDEVTSGFFNIEIEQETEQMVYYSLDNKKGLAGTKIHILSPRY
ncbi:MAG: hypothetical protein KAI28_01825, partial [Sphingomonadales bacterium]|nr:hypothetical protein [Sphingomonadales bacterium]